MAITPPPIPPNRNDPENFSPRMDAMMAWFPGAVEQMNLQASQTGIADGTQAAPGMSFASSLGTGVYRPGANQMGFAVNGVRAGLLTTTYTDFIGLRSGGAVVLTKDNAVGTIGSGTSAIIERGSNANGEYIRWADGTQICTQRPLAALDGTSQLFSFPASFSASPVGSWSIGRSSFEFPGADQGAFRTALLTIDQNGWSFNTAGGGRNSQPISLTAIGRWK